MKIGSETEYEVWFVPADSPVSNYLVSGPLTKAKAVSTRDSLNEQARQDGKYVAVKVTIRRVILP